MSSHDDVTQPTPFEPGQDRVDGAAGEAGCLTDLESVQLLARVDQERPGVPAGSASSCEGE